MKIFIDSAQVEEIEELANCGILDGVTTNPSLIKKAVDSLKQEGKNVDIESYIKKILKTAGSKRPVSLEVIGTNYKDMIREGFSLYKKFNSIAKNVYVKIPVNPSFSKNDETFYDGVKAIKYLSDEGIPVNCTLIFTPEQALISAKAGAKIVSPFAGRIDDYLREKAKIKFGKSDYYPAGGLEKNGKMLEDNGVFSGVQLVSEIISIFKFHNIKTEVLAASIRNPRQLREVALVGADIATAPFEVLRESLLHEKTIEGMKKFTKDVVPEYARLFDVKRKNYLKNIKNV